MTAIPTNHKRRAPGPQPHHSPLERRLDRIADPAYEFGPHPELNARTAQAVATMTGAYAEATALATTSAPRGSFRNGRRPTRIGLREWGVDRPAGVVHMSVKRPPSTADDHRAGGDGPGSRSRFTRRRTARPGQTSTPTETPHRDLESTARSRPKTNATPRCSGARSSSWWTVRSTTEDRTRDALRRASVRWALTL